MIRAFRSLIERQMAKAAQSGQLSGLEGEGKPLPDRSGEALVDPGLAAGVRIMAEAGAVPEEFPLKKQLDAARAAYPKITDPDARKAAMAELADLEMRYNMARDARKAFFR
ncbi:DUF1992 domain-containing protein [Ruegeria sp. TM1040]|jgi:hypothetical protein|uniref:DnaJ family domain-containing protein n=1 Tax=Rhodobacterales TaxID=204455 RepID=UPI000046307B|nr:DUF1992 domain-containing protein [Ruegeria sp. TM1040]ABF64707.1 hypothetical protein TM1040_1975 [Ruegeria sp. TM1040]MDF9303288.1 DUF1992 domain-containing protein [Tritonibacter mobilis]